MPVARMLAICGCTILHAIIHIDLRSFGSNGGYHMPMTVQSVQNLYEFRSLNIKIAVLVNMKPMTQPKYIEEGSYTMCILCWGTPIPALRR